MSDLNNLPGVLDFSIYIGASLNLVLTWTSNGSPVDLTGFTTAAMKVVDSNGNIIFNMTNANSQILLGGTAGTITLSLSSAQTLLPTVPSTNCNYDLILTSGSGVVTALVAGTINFESGPTLGV